MSHLGERTAFCEVVKVRKEVLLPLEHIPGLCREGHWNPQVLKQLTQAVQIMTKPRVAILRLDVVDPSTVCWCKSVSPVNIYSEILSIEKRDLTMTTDSL
jgi:hypothetical protein